jgi:hypothetical protein
MSDELVPRRPDPLPWERQKGESGRAFSNFAEYRDLGPHRSIAKVAAFRKLHPSTLEEQSRKYRWIERAQEYDDWVDRRRREQMETERLRVDRETDALGAMFVAAAFDRIRGRPAAIVQGGARDGETVEGIDAISPGDLEWRDLVAVANKGIELRRLAAGLATSLVSATAVNRTDLIQTIRDVVEILLPFIPEELQDRAIAAIEGYFEAGRRAA